jgi:hypothetical protein
MDGLHEMPSGEDIQIFEELTLEALKFQAATSFAPYLVNSLRFYMAYEPKQHVFKGRVFWSILGQKKKQKIEMAIEVPASPWDHFKDKYFPHWLERRFPVKKKKITKEWVFTASILFPHLDKIRDLHESSSEYYFYIDPPYQSGITKTGLSSD